MSSSTRKANRLAKSSSPYLRQHAYNPVDWYPWGEEALEKARKEDKPLLISIGYSACHWCHVMERESFENDATARIMNQSFVCIKVDREERPDVDQIYMDAAHAMGLQGGWPLNVFATPDQKPFYGGTYFRPDDWQKVLRGISDTFTKDRTKIETSAANFTKAIAQSEISKYNLSADNLAIDRDEIAKSIEKLVLKFDRKYGGLQKAPKFPMPGIWRLLLAYDQLFPSSEVAGQIDLTLTKIARGGIHDQLRGGFARYSVDEMWFAPHFEKMLYDNGQLISLYANAYRKNADDEYLEVIDGVMAWLTHEMTNKNGGFYSALDADSEGVEGKFYVWTANEIAKVLDNSDQFNEYFNVTPAGNWENGQNILHRDLSQQGFVKEKQLDFETFQEQIAQWKISLMAVRDKRTRPGLDDKIIAGWNGIMLNGIVDALIATGKQEYLKVALTNAIYIRQQMMEGEEIIRIKGSNIKGMLEDYVFVTQAYISLYQVTFDLEWLECARNMTTFVITDFYDPKDHFFFFSSEQAGSLIARKKEIFDNVIPSSNSQMAQNLWVLGHYFENFKWIEMAEKMVRTVKKLIVNDAEYLPNWGHLALQMAHPFPEIAIVGPDALDISKDLKSQSKYPFLITAGSNGDNSTLPILENRQAIGGRNTLYVCFNKTCKQPVHSVQEALDILGAINNA